MGVGVGVGEKVGVGEEEGALSIIFPKPFFPIEAFSFIPNL